jgi:8-oxo-dGTP pyrophosphatase MutT (NUDIX family)
MGKTLSILVLDDKEQARLQIEHSLSLVGGFEPQIDWAGCAADLAALSQRRYDLAFVDFFLDRDKTYGVDFLDRLTADCVIGFSSNLEASELIERQAKEKGFAETAAIAKIKTEVANPVLEAFFRALPGGRPGNKPLWLYRQSGVVPWLRAREGLRILLVSSRRSGEWIVPKGVVERNLSPEASALKEAKEEAGILGRLSGPELGRYRFPKWEGICTVALFPMEILRVLDTWDEKAERKRILLPTSEALASISNPDLQRLVSSAVDSLEGGEIQQRRGQAT